MKRLRKTAGGMLHFAVRGLSKNSDVSGRNSLVGELTLMILLRLIALCCLAASLAGCNPEEQKKLDMQACSGYGFQAGTNEFSTCMMQTAQHRSAQQTAMQQQQSYNNMISDQAQRDRDAQSAANQAAQDAAHQAEVQRLMSTDSSMAGMGVPSVTTPTIPAIDTSNMHCTGSSIANAGTMSCSSN
jgi:hypothetical protein